MPENACKKVRVGLPETKDIQEAIAFFSEAGNFNKYSSLARELWAEMFSSEGLKKDYETLSEATRSLGEHA